MSFSRFSFPTLALACATVLPAANIYPLGQNSTSGFVQGSATGPAARGWDFVVNDPDVTVRELGINPFLSTNVTLTLWDTAAQSELAQVTISATGGAWTFASLLTPVSLTVGSTYSIIGWANTSDSWYLYQSGPPAGFAPTGTIQYVQTRFQNGSGANTFPTSLLPNYMYGVPDIGYTIGASTATPEPISMSLTGLGVVALLTRRKIARKRG